MGDESNDLLVTARLRDELAGGLRNIRRELEHTEKTAEKLGATTSKKTSAGFDAVDRSSKRMRTSVSQAHQTLLSMSSDLGSRVESDLKRGSVALGAFGTATAVFGLKSASNFQTSRIAFDTLLGSVERGNALFDQLQQLNLKTPFELTDIAPATQLLLRYGVAGDQVTQVLQGLMDAAALSGDPANNLQRLALATGQVISQGRILGQDARQLAESGINVYDIVAQKLHITQGEARKLGEEGKLSSDLYIQALLRMEGPLAKLQGGAEKLNQTLMGQVSNLKDAIRVRLADTASPLTEELTRDMPAIVNLAGDAAEKIGTPIFGLLGRGVDMAERLIPLAEGPLAALFGGLGQLLEAGGPAIQMLAPVSDELTDSLTQLVTELLPEVPDIVAFFVALVGLGPDLIRMFGDLVHLGIPLLDLATGLLEFEPARKVLALLLITLLGYSKVSAVVGGLRAFGIALGFVGDQAAVAGVKADIAWGKLAALGAIAGGAALAGPALGKVVSGKANAGDDLQLVAGTTLAGAGLGSIIPGVGTAFGAGAGLIVGGTMAGLGHLFGGDPVVPGRITMAHHGANAGAGSSLRHITSGMRDFGVRSSASGHVRGTAVDVAGPGLTGYVQRVRQNGGWAVIEGAGRGMHAHADFGDPAMPGGRSGPDGGGGITVAGPLIGHLVAHTQLDYEAGLEKALTRVERDRYRRGYAPVRRG